MDRRKCLKYRFQALLLEAEAGVPDARVHAQSLAYRIALDYRLPQALSFYNALDFPEPSKADLTWIDCLSETDEVWKTVVRFPCNECCHRMLNAAYSFDLDDEGRLAYLMLAADTADGDELRGKIDKAIAPFGEKGDERPWREVIGDALFLVSDMNIAASAAGTV